MASQEMLVDLDLGGVARIVNAQDPTSAQDYATKAYVDANLEGLAWKDSCRAASTANISLASPGATIDGVTMVSGDRFLAKNQSAPAENGIYVWNGAAVPATRSADMNAAAEVEGATVPVEEGTANANTTWRQSAVNVTLGTTALAWSTFGTVAPSASETTAGIAEIATQAETDAGTDDARIVTPLKLANFAGRAKRFAANFGDGSSTQFDIVHNLGTTDVVVSVRRNSDGRHVTAQVTSLNTTTVRINVNVAPASNALRATIVA
jgi:hypothetical protein